MLRVVASSGIMGEKKPKWRRSSGYHYYEIEGVGGIGYAHSCEGVTSASTAADAPA